jgi:phage-related baseplate assembly protein
MLAFATGADLEHLGALFGVTRKTLVAGNPSAIPPVEAVMEADADLRYRITLALEGLSTAGPEGAYLYHALKSESVKHASVTGPPILSPGQVLVTLLGTTGSGAVSSTVISEVAAILNDEDVRPLTDQVTVQGATIIPYTIQATLYTYAGPDSAVVIQQAQAAAQAFADGQHRIGYDIPRSGIFAALHVAGVQRVELTQPAADITVNYAQAAFCTGLNITHAGVAE